MIERDKVAEMVKSCLPRLDEDVVGRIAEDIARDVETIIYSLIRHAVAQEREQLFRSSFKNW